MKKAPGPNTKKCRHHNQLIEHTKEMGFLTISLQQPVFCKVREDSIHNDHENQ